MTNLNYALDYKVLFTVYFHMYNQVQTSIKWYNKCKRNKQRQIVCYSINNRQMLSVQKFTFPFLKLFVWQHQGHSKTLTSLFWTNIYGFCIVSDYNFCILQQNNKHWYVMWYSLYSTPHEAIHASGVLVTEITNEYGMAWGLQ